MGLIVIGSCNQGCQKAGISPAWPIFNRPGRYFTAKLAVAGKRPVFSKFVPAAGILKMNICSNCKKN